MKKGLMVAFAIALAVPAAFAQVQVLVTNNDSQSVPVSDARFGGPFAAQCSVFQLPSGVASGSCAITVPSNKIFVIEQVSAAGGVPTGQKVQYTIRVRTAGQGGGIGFLYPVPASLSPFSGETQDAFHTMQLMKLYADPGTNVTLSIARSNGTVGSTSNFSFILSGYLINP